MLLRRSSRVLASLFALSLAACLAPVESSPDEAVDAEEEGLSAALRFDVATLNCASSAADESCAKDVDKCFCAPELDALNYGKPPGTPHSRKAPLLFVESAVQGTLDEL